MSNSSQDAQPGANPEANLAGNRTAEVLSVRREQNALIADLSMETERLEADLQAAQRREAVLIDQLNAAQGQTIEANDRFSAAKEADQRVAALEDRYDAIQREIVSSRVDALQLEQSQKEAADGRNTIDSLREQLTQEQRQRQAAEREIHQLIAERDQARKDHRDTQQRWKRAEEERSVTNALLQEERDQLRAEAEQQAAQVERLAKESQHSRAAAEITAALQDERDFLAQKLESLRTAFDRSLEENVAVIQQMGDERHTLKAITADLRQHNKTLQHTCTQMEDSLAVAQHRCDELEAETMELREQFSQAKLAFKDNQNQLRQENGRVQRVMESLLAKVDTHHDEHVKRVTLEEQLEHVTADRDRLVRANKVMENQLAETEQELAEEEARSARERAERQVSAAKLQHELQQFKQEHEEAQEELIRTKRQYENNIKTQESAQVALRERMDEIFVEAKNVCERAREIQQEAKTEADALRRENQQLRDQLIADTNRGAIANADLILHEGGVNHRSEPHAKPAGSESARQTAEEQKNE